jgi:hypothetical protein
MAITQNNFTGDGSTVLFSFTFPYLDESHIKVSLNGSDTILYTLANATTIQMNTAPANGVAIRIYRNTDSSSLEAQFFSGSSIRAQDLNDNFTQIIFKTQETENFAASTDSSAIAGTAASAVSTANTALTIANTANATANGIAATANTALSNSTAAVTTANAASALVATAVPSGVGAIVNADINASAGIADTKLATIATAGKIADSALPDTISSSITGSSASCTGNAVTATNLSSNRTFALTGDVTGSVSSNLSSGMSISATVAAGALLVSAGAVGSYQLCRNSSGATVNADATVAGSNLKQSVGLDGSNWIAVEPSPAGTWRNMSSANLSANRHALFQRIS